MVLLQTLSYRLGTVLTASHSCFIVNTPDLEISFLSPKNSKTVENKELVSVKPSSLTAFRTMPLPEIPCSELFILFTSMAGATDKAGFAAFFSLGFFGLLDDNTLAKACGK